MDSSFKAAGQFSVSNSDTRTDQRKCYIVDDSDACVRFLSDYIGMMDGLKVEGTFCDPVLALKELAMLDAIDILFIDVEMPVLSGLELAHKLNGKINVLIFTSAHGHYALESYGVKAKGYLLKPFSFSMLEEVVRDAMERSATVLNITPKSDREYIFIKNKHKNFSIVKLNLKDIMLAESVHDDIILYTTGGDYTTHLSLKKLEELLTGYDNFVRIHRAFVVSLAHITEVRKNKVAMSNGTEVCIGDFYRGRLFEHINANLITCL